MIEFFRRLLSSDYMPHGTCYLWDPSVLWLNVVSDGFIALSYYTIPVLLFSFVRQRRDLRFRWIFVAFGFFILACGSTHLLGVWTVWHATYRLDGVVRAITAVASVATAALLAPLVPVLVSLPSPSQLAGMNDALAREVAERKAAEEEVRRANLELERRVAERTAELQASMERYRFLADAMPQIVWTATPDGAVDYFNQRWYILTGSAGIGPEEWHRRIHPEDRESIMATWEHAVRTGEAFETQFRLQTAGGEYRWQLSRALAMRSAEGEITHWVGTSTDVNRAKRTEQDLQRAHHELQTVLDTTPLSIFAVNPEGQVTNWNRTAEEMLGFPHKAPGSRVARPELAGGTAAEGPVSQALERGVTSTAREVRLRRLDGSLFDASEWVSPLRSDTGEIRGAICVVADNTEKKRLEEQLLHSQKMEAVGRLAGGVAHDFNNLLTVISGFNEMIAEGVADRPGLADYASEVKNAATRAGELTNQLLAFSRKQLTQPKLLDVNSIVSRMEKMLQRLIGEDIELAIFLAPELGKIEADAGQIEQVLLNLAVNARDAMPHGGKLTIETANTEIDQSYADRHLELKPGRYVQLAVTDNGAGMTPEVRRRLFEPFFTTKEVGSGTGLGLSIVYGVVKQNGGDIVVYSEPGKGASFKIFLPAREPGPIPEAPEEVAAEQGIAATILVVEDEPGLLKLVRSILEQQGYSVLTAARPEDALRVAREHAGRIDLMLTDVVMPQMGGPELARMIAAERGGLKVIYMSGYAEAGIMRHGLLEAGIEFVHKPFSAATLTNKIRAVLRGGGSTGSETA